MRPLKKAEIQEESNDARPYVARDERGAGIELAYLPVQMVAAMVNFTCSRAQLHEDSEP